MFSASRGAFRSISKRQFSTSRRADMAKMSLIGRVVAPPKVKTTVNDKEFLIYTVATNDPIFGQQEEGKPLQPTSSFHNIFCYGSAVERLKNLEKGSLVHVDATFTVKNERTESGEYKSTIYAHHDRLHLIQRPKARDGEEEYHEEH
ncbi:hypothetical protein BT69DRAFT_1266757 [Atractiella rhizophila]|nr:hypothetical protein BT69DRAFT_1266757 [Atractiella rhizophila]